MDRMRIGSLATAPLIVGVGGTTRSGSTTEKALMVALRAAEEAGADIMAITGADLALPMYAPERVERTREATHLVESLRRADGVILASPGYHGSISGLMKNALDYAEDLRADARVYLDGRAVGCIACAYGWNAAGQTLNALRAIAHALRGWPTPLGAMINSSEAADASSEGWIHPPSRSQLETIGRQVVDFARMTAAVQQWNGEVVRPLLGACV
jgi:FMN reductase